MNDEQKQIEEMAQAMSDFVLEDSAKCDIELSKHLIAKGYRKQVDTVREFLKLLKEKESPKLLMWEYGEGYLDCIKTAEELAAEYGVEVEE